jgi:hypothetical protein
LRSDFWRRAARATRDDFRSVLDQVPDIEPDEGDRL